LPVKYLAAVHGMLPKGRLGRQIEKKLFVYEGNEHKQVAQKATLPALMTMM